MSSLTGPDPEKLLLRARQGNGPALGELLEAYRSYLLLLGRLQVGRRLQGKVEVSDLVQETFVAACQNFAQFRGGTEGELVSWLRGILASRLAKALRRYYGTRRRNVRLERELVDDLEQSSRALGRSLAESGSSPSERAARREQSVLLAQALDLLAEDYREVIVLRHLEGLPFAGVAQRMGRTVDSVKKLWTRALGQLRRQVGEGT